MDQTIIVTVVVVYPTAQDTLTPSVTPTPTMTLTPDSSYIYATVPVAGQSDGQMVQFHYEITAGDAAIFFTLFLLLIFVVVLVVMGIKARIAQTKGKEERSG